MKKPRTGLLVSPYLYLFIADHALLIYAAYYSYVKGGGLAALAAVLAVPFLAEPGGLIPRERPLTLAALAFLLVLVLPRTPVFGLFLFLLLLLRLVSHSSKQAVARFVPEKTYASPFFTDWGAPLVYFTFTLLLYLDPQLQYRLIIILYLLGVILCIGEGYLSYQKPVLSQSPVGTKKKPERTFFYTALANGAASGFLIILCFQVFPVGEISARLGGFFLASFLLFFYLGKSSAKFLAALLGEKFIYSAANYLPGVILLPLVFYQNLWAYLPVLGLSGLLLGIQEHFFFSGMPLRLLGYFSISRLLHRVIKAAYFISLLGCGWYLSLNFELYPLVLLFAFLLLIGGIMEVDRYIKPVRSSAKT